MILVDSGSELQYGHKYRRLVNGPPKPLKSDHTWSPSNFFPNAVKPTQLEVHDESVCWARGTLGGVQPNGVKGVCDSHSCPMGGSVPRVLSRRYTSQTVAALWTLHSQMPPVRFTAKPSPARFWGRRPCSVLGMAPLPRKRSGA